MFRGPFWSRLERAGLLWVDHDGGVLSAAVAYYASLSILPFFLLVFAVVDHFAPSPAGMPGARGAILDAIAAESSTQLRDAVTRSLAQTDQPHLTGRSLSLIWLVTMAVLVFAQIDRGFDRISGGGGQNGGLRGAVVGLLKNRFRAVLLLTGLASVLGGLFVMSITTSALERVFERGPVLHPWGRFLLHAVIQIAMNGFFFSLLFKWFSRGATHWRDVIETALFLALTWEIGRQLLSLVLGRDYAHLYGVIGSFLMILLWTYYASMLLFFWAAYLTCLSQERRRQTETD
jgi:membrane protein